MVVGIGVRGGFLGNFCPRVQETDRMKKEELILALRALAMKHPHAENVGYMWKNPLNPKSKGRRWTPGDLRMFRRFQLEYQG